MPAGARAPGGIGVLARIGGWWFRVCFRSVLQPPGEVVGGLVAAGGAGGHGAVEVRAQFGEDGLDVVDGLAEPRADGLAGSFGGAVAEGPGASGESGGSAEFGDE